jgi:catechol 2,3-dioxygenase-like lactoylglutathione lyase family enzyme
MTACVNTAGLYVRDQDEALSFYVEKLGFIVHTDVRNGDYRWLTVQHPDQPTFQLGLFTPGPPVHDAATAQALRENIIRALILNCFYAFQSLAGFSFPGFYKARW